MSSEAKENGLSMVRIDKTCSRSAQPVRLGTWLEAGRRTVLHDVADDAKLVKVAPAALGAKGLLEGELDVADKVFVEGRVDEDVAEADDEHVLDHLLAEVVVDPEGLLLLPGRLELAHHVARALEVVSEGLLDDDSVDALVGVAGLLEVLGDGDEDVGRQGHVKDAVAIGRLALGVGLVLELDEMVGQLLEVALLVVLARDVGADLEEVANLLSHGRDGRLDV
jgi:hypothetical protein